MNFTEYMNRRIYGELKGTATAIGEQRDSAYHADKYVDLANADQCIDLETTIPVIETDCVRMGEVLEHLTNDAKLLRSIKAQMILVTVPFYGVAEYHVRLHNDWSIRQLLRATGWRVTRYIPRKAPRLDKPIWMLRVMGQWVNALFFWLNPYLPIKPNGGYYFCVPEQEWSIAEENRRQFTESP